MTFLGEGEQSGLILQLKRENRGSQKDVLLTGEQQVTHPKLRGWGVVLFYMRDRQLNSGRGSRD